MTYAQAKVYCIAESETQKKYHEEAKRKQEITKAGELGQSNEFHLKRNKERFITSCFLTCSYKISATL